MGGRAEWLRPPLAAIVDADVEPTCTCTAVQHEPEPGGIALDRENAGREDLGSAPRTHPRWQAAPLMRTNLGRFDLRRPQFRERRDDLANDNTSGARASTRVPIERPRRLLRLNRQHAGWARVPRLRPPITTFRPGVDAQIQPRFIENKEIEAIRFQT